MPTYMIDDAHGNWIRNAGDDYDRAKQLAQEIADERGEVVSLYQGGGRIVAVDEDDPDVAEVASETIEPSTVCCECGAWSGERCSWVGPESDTVLVEYMPEQHRASHTAAGNRGMRPGNGANRIRVERSCADGMVEHDGDWCEIVKE